VLQWTLWAASKAAPAHRMWACSTHVLPAEKRDAAAAAKGAEEQGKRLAVPEGHLAQHGPFLLGAAFTIADLNLAAVLMGSWMNGSGDAPLPRAKAWLDACFNRAKALVARKMREG
jgi:glutathione S-transferase